MKTLDKFKSDKDFKSYLRKEGILMATYFEEMYPQTDLFTGELIRFKDRATYGKLNFLNKRNMFAWLQKQPQNKAVDYIKNRIHIRKSDKKANHAFSQVELRSIKDIPSINVIEKFIDYNLLCTELEFFCLYDYCPDLSSKHKDLTIGIDTREQKPLDFGKAHTHVMKLDYGDYTFLEEDFHNIFIERKSIADLFSTLTETKEKQSYQRFRQELTRAHENMAYIIVMVEYPFSKAMSYNRSRRFSKASAEFIFHKIREIHQDFSNCQFVFSGNREKSSYLIRLIGQLGERVRSIDLQYCIDTRLI